MKCFRMSLITITHASAYTAQHHPNICLFFMYKVYLFVFDVSEVWFNNSLVHTINGLGILKPSSIRSLCKLIFSVQELIKFK